MKTGLFVMDCAEGLKTLAPECVDLCVTSPPYDNLRTYTGEDDWNFEKFKAVAHGITRALKQGGVVAWVVNDAVVDGSYTGSSFRQCLYFMDECGLRFHQPIVWKKSGVRHPNPNRYHPCTEWIWIMSKGRPKTFNPIEDRPNKKPGIGTGRGWRDKDGKMQRKDYEGVVKEVGRRYNVFDIPSQNPKPREDHPAVFPDRLARDLVVSYSNPGDVVLDPFTGSGTTWRAAKEKKRLFIGFEIAQKYAEMALRRDRETLV